MDKTAELQSAGLTEVMFSFASMMQHQKSSFMIFACFFFFKEWAPLIMFSVTKKVQNPWSVSHQKNKCFYSLVSFFF